MIKPKILFYDIETAPSTAHIWGLWQEVRSMDFVVKDWYVLCWSAKWLGVNKMMSAGIKSKSENDKQIVSKLWKLLDEADVVVAHNAIKFDCRKINTRFVRYGMKPPSPYKVVDTLRTARKYFYFTSNRLGDLGRFLKVGEKMNTGGFKLWKECMAGDKVAWKKMMRYCDQDVLVLEGIYDKMLPYMTNHPNLSVLVDRAVCPKCGSNWIQYRGHIITGAKKYKRFQCQTCGGWGRSTKSVSEGTTTRNV